MSDKVEAYCVKCKAKREMKDAQNVKMKTGRDALQGKCETCGTGMYKILAKQK
jgi:hypothetical protein